MATAIATIDINVITRPRNIKNGNINKTQVVIYAALVHRADFNASSGCVDFTAK